MKNFRNIELITFAITTICLLSFLAVQAGTKNIFPMESKEPKESMLTNIDINQRRSKEIRVIEPITNFKKDPGDSISVEGLLNYLKTSKNDLTEYSKVDISKIFVQNEEIYFVTLQQDFFWETKLCLILTQNNVILDVVDIGITGLDSLFEYGLVDISQGKFIAAYCSTHSGNGDLELISLDKLGEVKYSIPAIDNYYEDTEETAVEYGLSKEYGSNIRASSVFLDGKLHAEYLDVNNDGNTDIILKGIRQIYEDGDGNQILQKEYFIKQVYVFDTNLKDFVLDEILSENILLTKEK